MYRFSQRLAWVAGVALPLGETLRRWGTWWDVPSAYLDDVVIGVFLLAGAWMSQDRRAGARWLSAGWGCACGIGLLSVIVAASALDRADPSGVSGVTALAIKIAMVVLGFFGLAGALRGPETR